MKTIEEYIKTLSLEEKASRYSEIFDLFANRQGDLMFTVAR
jgi:hypothetical protein